MKLSIFLFKHLIFCFRFLAEREAAAASRKALLETQLASNKRDHDAMTRSNQEVITKLVAELHDAAQNQQSRNNELEENTQRKRAEMATDHAASAKILTDQTVEEKHQNRALKAFSRPKKTNFASNLSSTEILFSLGNSPRQARKAPTR